MSGNRLLFLITVGSDKDLDRTDTRRLRRDKTSQWRVDFDLPSRIHKVACGPDFAAMTMFHRVCGMVDMQVLDQLSPSEMPSRPRAAWAAIANRGHRDLIFVNVEVARALQLGSIKPLPTIEPFRLYGLVVDGNRLEHLVPIEDKEEFTRLLEGVSARTAAGA